MFPKILVVLFSLSAAVADAQHLGESRAAIVAQDGPAIEENHAKGTAIYRQGSWKIEIQYSGDVAKTLKVTKLDTLSEDDIQAILEKNSDGARWHELSINGPTRMWQRSDLATARCDRLNPRSIEMRDTPFQKTPTGAVGKASAALAQAIMPNFAPTVAPPVAPRPQAYLHSKAAGQPSRAGQVSPAAAMADDFGAKLIGTLIGVLLVVGLPLFGLAVLFKIVLPLVLKRRIAKAVTLETNAGTERLTAQVAARAAPPPLPPPAQSSARVQHWEATAPSLDNIGWENFELMAGELFRRQGYEVEIGAGLGPDGGIDLTLRRGGEKALVQCKCFAAENKVSVMAMREFYGLIMAEGAHRGIFMTTGLYSRDALMFAEGKPIELLGRIEVKRMVADATRPGENLYDVSTWLNDFVALSRVTDPVCPRCRHPMKLRRGVTGSAFWGCTHFPRCRGKRDARTALVNAFSYQAG